MLEIWDFKDSVNSYESSFIARNSFITLVFPTPQKISCVFYTSFNW